MGQFVITIPFHALGVKTYLAPKDCVFIGMMSSTADATLSTDPNITPTFLQANPTDASVRTEVYGFVNSTGIPTNLPPSRIPISAGTTLFVAADGFTFVLLLFDDEVSARISVT